MRLEESFGSGTRSASHSIQAVRRASSGTTVAVIIPFRQIHFFSFFLSSSPFTARSSRQVLSHVLSFTRPGSVLSYFSIKVRRCPPTPARRGAACARAADPFRDPFGARSGRFQRNGAQKRSVAHGSSFTPT